MCALGGKPDRWRYEPALQRDGQALAMPLFAAANAHVAPKKGANEQGAASKCKFRTPPTQQDGSAAPTPVVG